MVAFSRQTVHQKHFFSLAEWVFLAKNGRMAADFELWFSSSSHSPSFSKTTASTVSIHSLGSDLYNSQLCCFTNLNIKKLLLLTSNSTWCSRFLVDTSQALEDGSRSAAPQRSERPKQGTKWWKGYVRLLIWTSGAGSPRRKKSIVPARYTICQSSINQTHVETAAFYKV